MAEAISINEQSMEQAATRIKNNAEEIQNYLNLLKEEIAKIDGVWQDDNSKVYVERFQDLQKDFPKFYQNAYECGAFLTNVVKAYRENVLNPTSRAVNNTQDIDNL